MPYQYTVIDKSLYICNQITILTQLHNILHADSTACPVLAIGQGNCMNLGWLSS